MWLDHLDKQMNNFLTVDLLAYVWHMPLHLAQVNQIETNSGEIDPPVPRSEIDNLSVRRVSSYRFYWQFYIQAGP